LFTRLYLPDGTPVSEAQIIDEYAGSLARPVADKNGHSLVWISSTEVPHQIRTISLDNKGKLSPPTDLYNGAQYIQPIAAGLQTSALNLMFYDKSKWPFRMMLKTTPRSALLAPK
jgi:hypothetical protein